MARLCKISVNSWVSGSAVSYRVYWCHRVDVNRSQCVCCVE